MLTKYLFREHLGFMYQVSKLFSVCFNVIEILEIHTFLYNLRKRLDMTSDTSITMSFSSLFL